MVKLKRKPPAGAPWWWPGEQLRLFDPPELPAQGELFTPANLCGCSKPPTAADAAKVKRRRRRRGRAA